MACKARSPPKKEANEDQVLLQLPELVLPEQSIGPCQPKMKIYQETQYFWRVAANK